MKRIYIYRNIILIFYYILTIFASFYALNKDFRIYNCLLVFSAFILPIIPFLIFRILKLKPVYLIEIVFDLFILGAVSFASLMDGYELIPLWDKILHFLSGFLFAVFGMILYFYHKPDHEIKKSDQFNASFYTFMFGVLSAVLWEIWEYIISFFGSDPQHVIETGVHDTMQDIIVCTLGAFITAVACYRYIKNYDDRNYRKGLMMHLFEEFYKSNLK